MRISKPKSLLGLTLLLGVLSTVLIMNYLKGARSAQVNIPMTTMVIAAKQVPEGTRLTAKMLKEKTIPKDYAPAGVYKKAEQVVNQFSAVTLYSDQPIVEGQVASENTAKELTYKVPEGKRAITIAINAVSGVAGLIKPGDSVDLLLNYERVSASSNDPKENAVTILQNIQVLAVGMDLQKKEGVQAAENITLAVSPQDAELVVLSESLGKLKLTLRPIADKSAVSLPRFDYKKLDGMFP